MPTFVIIPTSFAHGTKKVNILSRLNGKGPADARAFAGIAYRVTADGDGFEAVYLRPLNGQKTNPPSPRNQRAVQYFAYPTGSSTYCASSTRTGNTKRARKSARRMDHAQGRHRRHPADRDGQWNRNLGIERNQRAGDVSQVTAQCISHRGARF
jgi:hypothetical protein